MNKLPSQQVLKSLLRYEESTGRLFWLPRPDSMFSKPEYARAWNGKFAHKEAFTATDTHGYRRGAILGIQTSAHRVIWKMFNYEDPVFIDHINGDPGDNRISNLRSVSHRENCRNMKLRSNNSSGTCGVSFAQREGKWRAYIKGRNHVRSLGYFDTLKEAVEARRNHQNSLGYHENHGAKR